MKQEYETPEMEMISFSEEDVIMTSGGFSTATGSYGTTGGYGTTNPGDSGTTGGFWT